MSFLHHVTRMIALLVGLGGVRYAVTCDTTAWSFPWLGYLVYWLPPTAILTLAVLGYLSWRLELNPYVITAVVGAIAWTQVITLWRNHDSRLAMSVMPLALIILTALSWASDQREPSERAAKTLNRYGHWVLVGVVLVVMADLTNFALMVRREKQRLSDALAEQERKDRELKGIERAAWLINLALFPSDFSEEQFVKNHSCRLRLWGDFRWDNDRQQLIITQSLFDELTRQRLLPHVDAVLEHPLLTPGIRDDLKGGVLTCKPELAFQVEWTVDVLAFRDRAELNDALAHNVDFIGRKLVQEFSP